MSFRFERSGGALVGATLLVTLLVAAMLALFPAAAEARTVDKDAPSVVVRPGDTLWSISAERLGPDATPQRVANGAERLHALNRGRIGADPNLIFVGQELLVPRAMSEPPIGETLPARKAASAAGANPRDRAAKGSAGKVVPGKAPRQGAIPRSKISLDELTEMLGVHSAAAKALPDAPDAAPVPTARAVRAGLASAASALAESLLGSPADARAERRQVLGLGVWALTLLVAVLVAWWKLPTRRAAPTRGARSSAAGTRRKAGTGIGRLRAPKKKAVARNGLALGAHNPEVRHASLLGRGQAEARLPRLRRGASLRGETRP